MDLGFVSLYPAIVANVNLDMIGRYRNGLTLHGIGSSTAWPALIERANWPTSLPASSSP